MMNSGYWQDLLRSGAILGVIMALSLVVEQYMMTCSDLSLTVVSLLYFVEWCVAVGLFVWLLYRFSRRRAEQCDARRGWSYAQALSYVVSVSMLTGIIVGLANTLFVSAIGYESYVEGLVARIAEMREMFAASGGTGYDAMFAEFVSNMRSSEQPSIWVNIYSSLSNYIFGGIVVGLVIAAFVRREPNIFIREDE